VLAAAHCLTEHEGTPLEPNFVAFYVGNNANPSGFGGTPSSGQLYQADAFVPNGLYDPDGSANDIGLVHLVAPATGVATYPYNTSTMTGAYVGQQAFYVGYGATDGVAQDGSGIKRSTSITIYNVSYDSYTSEYGGSGICFGDSGGPGLMQIGGQWRVVGVNSTVAGGSGGDPCTAYYNHMRVDYYADWIAGVIGAPPPSCQQNPDRCYCALACQPSGACNNSVCQTKDCEQIHDCMIDCGEDIGCQNDCYLEGTDAGKGLLDDMFRCFGEHCPELEGDAFQTCASDNCQTQIETCMPVATGPESCEFIYDCLFDCPADDSDCSMACYEQGTATAQDQLDAMFDCFNTECEGAQDWSACVNTSCADQLNTCMPPSNCAITGGDCATGEACYVNATGATDCFTSQELGAGQVCNPGASTLPCDDGMLCIPGVFGGRCAGFCLGDGDCSANEYCEIPVFTDVADIGSCRLRPTDAGIVPDAASGVDAAGIDASSDTDAGSETPDAATGVDAGTTNPDTGTTQPDSAITSPDGGSGGAAYLAPCGQDADCSSALCREVEGRGQLCLEPCDAQLGHYDCPANEESGCVPADTADLSAGGVCQPGVVSGASLNVGEACDASDGYRTCVSGICQEVCLMPCGGGNCPPGYACDTSQVADPGVCRLEEEPACGCTSSGASPIGGLLASLIVLAGLGRRRREGTFLDPHR